MDASYMHASSYMHLYAQKAQLHVANALMTIDQEERIGRARVAVEEEASAKRRKLVEGLFSALR